MERALRVVTVITAVVLAFMTGAAYGHHDLELAINIGAAAFVTALIAICWSAFS